MSAWRKLVDQAKLYLCGLHWKPRQLKKWHIGINIGLDWRALCLSVSLCGCVSSVFFLLSEVFIPSRLDGMKWLPEVVWGTYFTDLRVEHGTLLRWRHASKSVWLLSCVGLWEFASPPVFLLWGPAALRSLSRYTKPHSKQLALLSRRKLPPCSCFLMMVRFCSLNIVVADGDGLQCPWR